MPIKISMKLNESFIISLVINNGDILSTYYNTTLVKSPAHYIILGIYRWNSIEISGLFLIKKYYH